VERGGKKTAAAIHQEVTREIDTLLPRIFAERRKTGEWDVEAVELALRTALHAAGAAGLTELLRESGPVQTSVPRMVRKIDLFEFSLVLTAAVKARDNELKRCRESWIHSGSC